MPEIKLSNFDVEYLLKYSESINAIEDKKSPGWFRHKTVISAMSADYIKRDIRGKGGIPVKVSYIKPKKKMFGASRDYKAQFLTAIHFNVQAGMSAGKALEKVIENETGAMRTDLNFALNVLRAGRPFLEAMEALNFFDATTLAILEAGEQAGRLPNALRTAVDHYLKSSAALKMMFGAVSWTILDIVMAISSVVGNRYSMIPMLMENKPTEPDKALAFEENMQLAILVNDVMLWATVALAVFVGWIIKSYVGTNMVNKAKAEKVVMRIPAISDAIKNTGISASATVMSSLLKAGVPLDEAIQIARKASKVPMVIAYWNEVERRLQNGDSVAQALNQDMLDQSERLVIAAHGDRQQLAQAMDSIATKREELAAKASKRFAMFAFLASLVYSAIAVVITLWMVFMQSEQATTTEIEE